MMKEKRILFTGGGTAGHVIVNLALIPIFQKAGWNIDYIGSHDGIERRLIKSYDYVNYYPISTGKLRRYMSVENLKDPFKVLKGIMQAWQMIGKKEPSVVFSKGGFVSVPVVIAARLRGVPTIIHESDFTPGLANKIAVPFAKQVLTTFPETSSYLPEKKTTYIGPVIREELLQGSKEHGFSITGFHKNKPVLLIMGGSAGSQKINDIVRQSLDELLQSFQIIHICGENNVDHSIQRKGYVQFAYVNESLKDIFAITDYVVSRAGANAIFEFLALRIPMLLIPLSLTASRGDQLVNARSFYQKQFAHVLEEENLSKHTFIKSVYRLQQSASVLIDHMKTFKSERVRDDVVNIIKEWSDF